MNSYILPGASIVLCALAAITATRFPGVSFFLIGLVLGFWLFRGLIK